MKRERKQTKRTKEEFTIKNYNLINFLIENSKNGLIEIERIQDFLQASNRLTRHKISEVSMYYPVISLSQERGYEVLTEPETKTNGELLSQIERIDHQINDYFSRIDALRRKMKPLIAYKKQALKIIEERNKKEK